MRFSAWRVRDHTSHFETCFLMYTTCDNPRCASRPAAAARFDPPSGGTGPRRGLRLTSPEPLLSAMVPFERGIRMSPGIDQDPAASNRGPVPAISPLVWLSLARALAAGR